MNELTILVPVLGRPHRVAPFLDSARKGTPGAEVLFIADPADYGTHDALEAAGAEWFTVEGGYAKKINEGVRRSSSPLIFTAADDLDFHSGWFAKAKACLGDGIEVVGVNDLCAARVMAGEHATHFLMTRAYAETPCLDASPGPFSESYTHWYCDDELVATARYRNAIAFATDAVVEHLHPMVGKAEDDATYQLGRKNRKLDQKMFKRRSSLWA